MKTSRKILLVLVIAAFIYTCFGIEFSDLSWATNKRTYISLMYYLVMMILIIFEPEEWWIRKK